MVLNPSPQAVAEPAWHLNQQFLAFNYLPPKTIPRKGDCHSPRQLLTYLNNYKYQDYIASRHVNLVHNNKNQGKTK